ncbi:MAG: saccharopine dehydrogenase [Gammaproteobacteria bacterium]|nr:saccharopine dehydrogenase [Gammaproteobacteria bacterium]
MKIIIPGGCGGMGRFLVAAVVKFQALEAIAIADINESSARKFAEKFDNRVTGVGLDVSDSVVMSEVFKEFDVVLNMTGPFFLYGKPVLEAAIQSGCHYMDICDDWEPTEEMLKLDGVAKANGLTAIVGLGASPGLTNILALIAMSRLDSVHRIYTGWDMNAASPEEQSSQTGANAAMVHAVEQMIGEVKIYRDNRFEMVRPLEKILTGYPGVENSWANIFGHPEAITFPHHYPQIRESVNLCHGMEDSLSVLKLLRFVVEWKLISRARAAKILDWLEVNAFNNSEDPSGELPPVYGLAIGEINGKSASVGCALVSDPLQKTSMGEATAYPLACGLKMFIEGGIDRRGVFAPECGAIDPFIFLDHFFRLILELPEEQSFEVSEMIEIRDSRDLL